MQAFRSPVRSLRTLLLVSSAAFGSIILLTDEHLWEFAPGHAYALAGFVGIDLVLVGLMYTRVRLGLNAALAWGSIQAFVMLADLLTAPEFGMTLHEFAFDLLGNWAWDGLLLAQFSIVFNRRPELARQAPSQETRDGSGPGRPPLGHPK